VKQLERAGIAPPRSTATSRQGQRERALGSFRDGEIRILVATDIAARGIDVDGITHVVANFDLPIAFCRRAWRSRRYVHRIGRTAARRREGIAISFCEPRRGSCGGRVATSSPRQRPPGLRPSSLHSEKTGTPEGLGGARTGRGTIA
jgi:ATP-dependent RNA helicase RhlE